MPVATELPPEILVKIFSFLGYRDIFSCKCTNSVFYRLIQEHRVLEYQVLQEINDVEDNPKVTLPAAEKLRQLDSSKHGWMHAKYDFERVIPIKHPSSGLYDLTGGMYFSGNESRNALHYCKLPDTEDEIPEWDCIKVAGNRTIVDFGLCTYEHDLIVILTRRSSTTALNSSTLEVQFFKLSTHEPHPDAEQPVVAVYETSWDNFAAYIEVVGENLFLIVHHAVDFSAPSDQFMVYNWKTGKLKMAISAPYCSCYGMVPLAEDKILIVNACSHTFDLWKVSDTPEEQSEFPECCLRLPDFQANWFLRSLSCRGEPNPASKLEFSSQPYNSNPDNALVIVNLSLQSGASSSKFSFVIKRYSLLEFYDNESVPRPSTPVPQSFQDELMMLLLDGDLPSEEGRKTLSWDLWGREKSRIIMLSSRQMTWITVSAGERLVSVLPRYGNRPQYVEIYDFNPSRIKQAQAYLDEDESDYPNIEVVTEPTQIQAGMGFSEDVESTLPYSMVTSSAFPQFDLLLMDEHRLLGLGGEGEVSVAAEREHCIRVFHMGRPCEPETGGQ